MGKVGSGAPGGWLAVTVPSSLVPSREDAGEREPGEPSAFCISCGLTVARRSGCRCEVTWIQVLMNRACMFDY